MRAEYHSPYRGIAAFSNDSEGAMRVLALPMRELSAGMVR